MPVYHIEFLFVPEFPTGTYQNILYLFVVFHFFTVYPCLGFKKYTGTSKFPFRALYMHTYLNITHHDTTSTITNHIRLQT
jgi:hypothetical protein